MQRTFHELGVSAPIVDALSARSIHDPFPIQALVLPDALAGLEVLASRRLVDLGSIRTLVLDEADRMLDMGFQPQVDRIVRRLPRNRQTMFFSATLDGAVGELAHAYTNSPARFETEHAGEQPGEIEHTFVPVTADTKVEALVTHIRSSEGITLVFVRTKRGADKLVQKLGRQNVRAVAMHGDMSQKARERALAHFE